MKHASLPHVCFNFSALATFGGARENSIVHAHAPQEAILEENQLTRFQIEVAAASTTSTPARYPAAEPRDADRRAGVGAQGRGLS